MSSTNLSAVTYDDSNAVLYIKAYHGGTYSYSGVPRLVYEGLLTAGSKGQYFHAHIKDRYPYQRR